MDITNIYTIDNRIKNELDAQIIQIINENMYRNYWSNELDDNTKRSIQDELKILIKEAITPSVNNVFNKMGQKIPSPKCPFSLSLPIQSFLSI